MTSHMTRRHFNKVALSGLGATTIGGVLGWPHRAGAETTLNFQANWLNDPEFLGYMIGIDNGHYKAEGLSVNYMSGGPNLIPEGSLLSGKADIALTSMLTTGKAIVERNAPLKIIGTQYQKSPLGVISLVSNGITSPKDLVGKTIAVPPLSRNTFDAMIKLHNIAADQVKVVPYQFNPTPLINASVEAIFDFVTQMPFLIEQQSGKKATSFLAYDQGLPFYIDLVVVTEETLKTKRADLVKFLRASRKGWAENFADPKKYPKLYHDTWFKGLGSTIEAETYFNETQLPLMQNPKGIFAMSDDGIKLNIEALAKLGVEGKPAMFDTTVVAELGA
jgi:ABC-type nitrate/sulfonate/bicarbonate transport system substrate-binding protein